MFGLINHYHLFSILRNAEILNKKQIISTHCHSPPSITIGHVSPLPFLPPFAREKAFPTGNLGTGVRSREPSYESQDESRPNF